MHKSESIKNLAVALGKAQSEIGAVKFDSTNPFLKNKYASLGAVIETTRETLQKHGLTISQVPLTNEFGTGVTTILMHSSGEFLEGDMVGQISQEKGKSAAQVAGSLVSYFRRYSLAAILNIYSDEDTDGTQSPNKSRKTAQGGNSTAKKAKPEQIGKSGWTSEQITAVAEAHTDKHGKQIVSTMNLSKKLSRETAIPVLLKWFRVYKVERDNKVESQVAAYTADNKVFG